MFALFVGHFAAEILQADFEDFSRSENRLHVLQINLYTSLFCKLGERLFRLLWPVAAGRMDSSW